MTAGRTRTVVDIAQELHNVQTAIEQSNIALKNNLNERTMLQTQLQTEQDSLKKLQAELAIEAGIVKRKTTREEPTPDKTTPLTRAELEAADKAVNGAIAATEER